MEATVILDCVYNDSTKTRTWFVRADGKSTVIVSASKAGNEGLAECRKWLEDNHYHMASNQFPDNFKFHRIVDSVVLYGLRVSAAVAEKANANKPKRRDYQSDLQYHNLCELQVRNLAHKMGEKCIRV